MMQHLASRSETKRRRHGCSALSSCTGIWNSIQCTRMGGLVPRCLGSITDFCIKALPAVIVGTVGMRRHCGEFITITQICCAHWTMDSLSRGTHTFCGTALRDGLVPTPGHQFSVGSVGFHPRGTFRLRLDFIGGDHLRYLHGFIGPAWISVSFVR